MSATIRGRFRCASKASSMWETCSNRFMAAATQRWEAWNLRLAKKQKRLRIFLSSTLTKDLLSDHWQNSHRRERGLNFSAAPHRTMPSKKKKYYAYFVPAGNKSGVTSDWKKCESMVSGKTGARFKAFDAKADAERWIAHGAIYETKQQPKLERGVYFDAGTGRGAGVEVSVTDEKGKNLL